MPLPLDCSSCSCGGWYPPSIAIIRYTYVRRKEMRRQPSTGGKQDGEEERKKSYVNTWSEGYKSPPPIGKKRKNTTTRLQEYTRRILRQWQWWQWHWRMVLESREIRSKLIPSLLYFLSLDSFLYLQHTRVGQRKIYYGQTRATQHAEEDGGVAVNDPNCTNNNIIEMADIVFLEGASSTTQHTTVT